MWRPHSLSPWHHLPVSSFCCCWFGGYTWRCSALTHGSALCGPSWRAPRITRGARTRTWQMPCPLCCLWLLILKVAPPSPRFSPPPSLRDRRGPPTLNGCPLEATPVSPTAGSRLVFFSPSFSLFINICFAASFIFHCPGRGEADGVPRLPRLGSWLALEGAGSQEGVCCACLTSRGRCLCPLGSRLAFSLFLSFPFHFSLFSFELCSGATPGFVFRDHSRSAASGQSPPFRF